MTQIVTILRRKYNLPATVTTIEKLQDFCLKYPAAKNWKALCFVLSYMRQQVLASGIVLTEAQKADVQQLEAAMLTASKNWERAAIKEKQ